MNTSKAWKLILVLGGVIVVLGLILFFASDGNGMYEVYGLWGLMIGGFVAVIGLVFFFIDRSQIKKADGKYSNIAYDPISDYAKELEKVRENFAADGNEKKNRTVKCYYPGSDAFYDYDVIRSGKIYYSAIVQANTALFKRGGLNDIQPAVVLYSEDEHFAEHPRELIEITAYMLKDDPNLLGDGSRMFFNRKLTVTAEEAADIGSVYTLYMTCVMIHKAKLPAGRLVGWLLPIIADPKKTSSFVVEPEYWTNGLIGEFMSGNKKTDSADSD